MRRTVWLFIALLIAIGIFLHYHWRVLSLFKAAMLLNTVACAWYLKHIFAPPKDQRKYPVLQPVLCILLVLFNAIVFMGVYQLYRQDKVPVTVLSEPMPAMDWTGLDDGSKHPLSELKGHVLVLHFWASWCGPCRQEFPELLAFARLHPEINILAFDVSDDPGKAWAFLSRLGVGAARKSRGNLFLAADADSQAALLFKIQNYPSTILVDPEGMMRRRYARPVRWKDNWMVSDWHHWAGH